MPAPLVTTTPRTALSTGDIRYAALVSCVAALSGLLFGFDIAVINGALIFLRSEFQLSDFQVEIAASSLLAGCILGAGVGGWLSDRHGRRKMLLVSALLFAISSVGAALPRNLAEFIVARLAGGVAIGIASLLAPMYIAEVAPAAWRGRLVALNQMAIVSGILLSYLANWLLAASGPAGWRWMFAVGVFPAAGFLIALFFVPESPRWLAEKDRWPEAERIVVRINGVPEAQVELAGIREAIAEESGTLGELFSGAYRPALVLALVLAVMQQWTGINTVLFYGSLILREQVSGQSADSALGANVLIGVMNCISTIVALYLIDRIGRKPLLIGSSLALAVSLAALGAVFRMTPPPPMAVIALMLLAALSFAVGLGPCVWVLMAEVFPNRVRGRAMALATVSLWTACTILTLTFLSITSALTVSGAFWIYAVLGVFTAWFVARHAPETKGRRLEEIEQFWKGEHQ
jgi:SP family arabinose:H+ symporter-like MFS transporter